MKPTNPELLTPPRPNNKNKVRKLKDINGNPVQFKVLDEIVVPHGKGKLIYFQQLRHEPAMELEYRLCYYMIGVKESRKGRWVFGQFALMAPAKLLVKIYAEAKKRAWEGFE